MSEAKTYFLVTKEELDKINAGNDDSKFLDYNSLYEKIISEDEKEKLQIKAWTVFDWKLK